MKAIPDHITILCTTIPPPGLRRRPGIRIIHPFAGFIPESKKNTLPAENEIDLPRNTSAYLPLLAGALRQFNPGAALYVSPADPREFLALYEAWQSRTGSSFSIGKLSVHDHLPPEQRAASLEKMYQFLDIPPHDRAPENTGRDPAFTETGLFENSPAPAAASYLRCLDQAGLQTNTGESISRPARVCTEGEDGREPPTPVAIFGDWLLADELTRYLEDGWFRIAFIQKAFDVTFGVEGPDSDSDWIGHFFFRPLEQRMESYRRCLLHRRVAGLICVSSSFSLDAPAYRHLLTRLNLPVLFLESEIPGRLTQQNRIRLENFLRRVKKCPGTADCRPR